MMHEIQQHVLTAIMLINIGTASVGFMTGFKAVRLMHGRHKETYHLVYLGVLVCVTFIAIDISWYYFDLSRAMNFYPELAIRSWQLLVVTYATLTLAEQAKCTIQSNCPRRVIVCKN